MGSLSRSTSTSPFSMALPLSLASLNLPYYSNKTKLDGSIWRTEDKGGHSSGHGQIRMQIQTLGFWVFDLKTKDGMGREWEGIPLSDTRRRRSARRTTGGRRHSPCRRRYGRPRPRQTERERREKRMDGRRERDSRAGTGCAWFHFGQGGF